MTITTPSAPLSDPLRRHRIPRLGQPTATWREEVFTRATELEAQRDWLWLHPTADRPEDLSEAIAGHLEAARAAAHLQRRRILFSGPLRGRAKSNLDAAEANLLQISSGEYLEGQMPCLLNHVQRHLQRDDPRRTDFERIARKLGVEDPTQPTLVHDPPPAPERARIVAEERKKIVSTVRAASSASLREQLRLRSFRNVLLATTAAMTMIAVGLAVMGVLSPETVPLCFQPDRNGTVMVVCPTAESSTGMSAGAPSVASAVDIDEFVKGTAGGLDLLTVEIIGLTAAAVAAAAALRHSRGSSEPYDLSVALALLKLPTGAVTAFLGLLLMRGQFVPGLTALDTSAQILAWALLFGYAQQLFTRFVDQQAQTVQDSVRGANKAA